MNSFICAWSFTPAVRSTPLLTSTASGLAVVPAQDLLGLGADRRMNTPGTVDGNWRFRLEPGALTPDIAQRLRGITEKHQRA